MNLTNDVQVLLKQLEQCGYQAFIVGGCVRDSLLDITPHDWDICTNALPEQIKQCFSSQPYQAYETGIQHGTITVILNQSSYEITTYRKDGEYSDNRHPNEVRFVSSIEQDLSRRDFTVNAMAYNPSYGLIDLFGGKSDLKHQVIRCVGDSSIRFKEDALRILRAVRFASTYSFAIDREASSAIHQQSHLLENIAAERISSELVRLLLGDGVKAVLVEYSDVIGTFIPEILPSVCMRQNNPYHCYDVWEHTAVAVQNADKCTLVRLTMLFHDIGKPACHTVSEDGVSHFYAHAQIGAQMAENIMKRLRFDKNTTQLVIRLIQLHDSEIPTTQNGMKRWLNKYGIDFIRLLLQVKLADVSAQVLDLVEERQKKIQALQQKFEDIVLLEECFTLKSLAVSGNDLKAIGITDGKQIGDTLRQLLDLVIDGELENKHSSLIKYARGQIQSSFIGDIMNK